MNKLTQLSKLVESSARHTDRQLQSIESSQLNLLISSIIAVVVALGVSALFEILTYWVSGSFLLMYLWGLESFIRVKKPKVSDLEKTSDSFHKLGKEKIKIGFEWFFANVSSLIKAIGVIYAITFLVLVLMYAERIEIEQPISMAIPIITSVVYLSSPLFIGRTVTFFTEGLYLKYINAAIAVKKPSAIRLGFFLAGFLLLLLIIFLPIWSLIVTRSLFLPFSGKTLLLVLVLLLQVVAIAILSSYFSSLTAKKELANTLTNYADIDYQINHLIIKDEVDDENDLKRLTKMYLTAKKYDILTNDYFKFVNFYYLLMNRTYLAACSENLDQDTINSDPTTIL